jgi:hypothetical protein
MNLTELKNFYPNAKVNEPYTNCKYCSGTGIWYEHFCICMYIDHDFLQNNPAFFDKFLRITETYIEYSKRGLN